MFIIKIEAEENGAHKNQISTGVIPIPDGWAEVAPFVQPPTSFPFVDLVLDQSVVVEMIEKEVPDEDEVQG